MTHKNNFGEIADKLEEVRKLLCPYPPGETCDCKYGMGVTTNLYTSEKTGCPELRSIIRIYRAAARP